MSVELVELEPLPGRRLTIDGEMSIGRQDCDVTVSSPQVSRRHASIAPRGEGAEITDHGSRNGTFVNDERVAESQALSPGDKLKIGETIWEVALVDEAAATVLEARGDVPAPPHSGVRHVSAIPPAAPPEHATVAAPPTPPALEPTVAPPAAAPPAAAPPAAAPPAAASAPAAGSSPALGDEPPPRASAARRMEATLICYAVVLLTAIAVVLYLATR